MRQQFGLIVILLIASVTIWSCQAALRGAGRAAGAAAGIFWGIRETPGHI